MPRKFVDDRRQEAYELARARGADKRSPYYMPDGTPYRQGLADVYWAGRSGEDAPATAAHTYPYWRAGRDDAELARSARLREGLARRLK